jgi:hypothetical protein
MENSNPIEQMKGFVEKKLRVLRENPDESGTKAYLAKMRKGVGKVPGADPELWGILFEDMPEELRPDAWGKLIINGASENGNDHAEFAKSIHEFVVVAIVTGTFGVEVGAAGINQKPKIPQLLQDRMNQK